MDTYRVRALPPGEFPRHYSTSKVEQWPGNFAPPTKMAAMESKPQEVIADLQEIYAHLHAACVQSIESDDPIIMGHVRDARALVERALKGVREITGGQSV